MRFIDWPIGRAEMPYPCARFRTLVMPARKPQVLMLFRLCVCRSSLVLCFRDLRFRQPERRICQHPSTCDTGILLCSSVPSHASSRVHSSPVHHHHYPKIVRLFVRSQSSEVTWVWLMSSEILASCLCNCRAPIHVSELLF